MYVGWGCILEMKKVGSHPAKSWLKFGVTNFQGFTVTKPMEKNTQHVFPTSYCRVPKGGGVQGGGGNWGTLRIPREDWGTLGNIRED